MYSWKFDTQPFKEEMLNCSMRGSNSYTSYASTKNKLFILAGGPGSKFSKNIKVKSFCNYHV